MTSARPPAAVVIGFGISGICAARALRERFEKVVVIEKDELPSEPVARRGVAQGEHLHNLLTGAQNALDSLFPGFTARLLGGGAIRRNVSTETNVFELGRWMPKRDLGMHIVCAPRPLIEHVGRGICLEDGRVEVLEGTSAEGLVLDEAGAIEAVRCRSREGVARTLPADVVVDATGVGSQSPRWLQDASRGRIGSVPVERCPIGRWYATAIFEHAPGVDGSDEFWLAFSDYPLAKSAIIAPMGGNRSYVSLSGGAADEPVVDFGGLCRHVAQMEGQLPSRLTVRERMVTPFKVFHRSVAVLRRYDLHDGRLPCLLPVGDAVAGLNPLLGQGISVAARQAQFLSTLLGRAPGGQLPGALVSEYLEGATAIAREAWTLDSVGRADPLGTTPSPAAVAARRLRDLAARAQVDVGAHRRYVEYWHMLRPVSELMVAG